MKQLPTGRGSTAQKENGLPLLKTGVQMKALASHGRDKKRGEEKFKNVSCFHTALP